MTELSSRDFSHYKATYIIIYTKHVLCLGHKGMQFLYFKPMRGNLPLTSKIIGITQSEMITSDSSEGTAT